jgi:hypothetical protein
MLFAKQAQNSEHPSGGNLVKSFIPQGLAPLTIPDDILMAHRISDGRECSDLAAGEYIPYLLADRVDALNAPSIRVNVFRVVHEREVHLFEQHAHELAPQGEGTVYRAQLRLRSVFVDCCPECLNRAGDESARVLRLWGQTLFPCLALLNVQEAVAELADTESGDAAADTLFVSLAEARRALEEFTAVNTGEDLASQVFLNTSSSPGSRVSLREWLTETLAVLIASGEKEYASCGRVDDAGLTLRQRKELYLTMMEQVYPGNIEVLGLFEGQQLPRQSDHLVHSIANAVLDGVVMELAEENYGNYGSLEQAFEQIAAQLRTCGPSLCGPVFMAALTNEEISEWDTTFDLIAAELSEKVFTRLDEVSELDSMWVRVSAEGPSYESQGLFSGAETFGVTYSALTSHPSVLVPLTVAGSLVKSARKYPLDVAWKVTAANPEDQFVLDSALSLLSDRKTSPLNLLPYCVQVVNEAMGESLCAT